ncbi:MAG: hypothetical protein MJE66_23855, partial [Proteobacteria bacterium]|nr:hypothetical protein [Pseudomonadota bacterium]
MATSSTLTGPGRPAPDANANRTVLSVLEGTSPLYWLGVGVGAVVFGVAQGVFLYQTYTGLGIAGYQAPI